MDISELVDAMDRVSGPIARVFLFHREDGLRVEERLQLPHLEQLMQWFQEHQPGPLSDLEEIAASTNLQSVDVDPKAEREPGLLTKGEFKETLAKVLGSNDFEGQLDNLFTRLDTSCDGFVDWNEFCTYMLLQFRENDYMRKRKQIPFQTEAKVRHSVHNRQETTSKIVAAENPTKYITVSKEGAIIVWDTSLHFEKNYSLTEREDTTHSSRRRVKEWVTDMVYMANSHKLAISSSGRDIRFFDATSTQYFEEFYLYGLPNVPSSMCYWYDRENPGQQSILLYGDDHGAINLLYFHRPLTQLFASPFKKEDGVQRVFFKDLQLHSRWVKGQQLEEIHNDTIRKLMYMPDNDCVISSSGSSKNSLVIMDIQRKKKTYVFRLNKGVDCFDYNKNINLLTTGSTDHLVRFWNPYVTSKPVAKLEGHLMSIVDIKIHENLNQVFSLSRDTILKVWDVREHTCLQTVLIKFPSSLLGRVPDFGPHPMHLQSSPQNTLLVTANDYVALLKVGQSGLGTNAAPTTHMAQLCCAQYNPLFKQVVTAADDSTMGVWDVETGAKTMIFANAHGKEEITCLAFDHTWRRLISGARNGTVKVWNIQNGHNLHCLESVSEAEVTGVTPINGKQMTLAVGWSRSIVKYNTSEHDTMKVKADLSWKSGQKHQEDILASAYSPSLALFVTASFDGEICVWSLEKESLYCQSNSMQQSKSNNSSALAMDVDQSLSNSSSQSSLNNSRPNSRHRKSHRPLPGQAAPVDKVIFLHSRTKDKKAVEAACLISSEAGVLRWWSLFVNNMKELGYFYAPQDKSDESVLGLCTNADDTLLISGDTHGIIHVWEIEDYCKGPQLQKVRDAPGLRLSWVAHDFAIVSVEYVHDAEFGDFLLTASTDQTAKLWDLSGHCVGCFGQKEPWNLRDRASWVDSGDDTGTDVLQVEEGDGTDDEEDETEGAELREVATDEDNPESDFEPDEVETLLEDGLHMPKIFKAHTSDWPHKRSSHLPPASLGRRHTFHNGRRRPRTVFKSFLGQSVNKQLARRITDRQNRRTHYGDVAFKETNKVGKLCCPYQVLATKDMADIELPCNLPMTMKMQSLGMTPSSLTLDDVRQLNLKDYDHAVTTSKDESHKPLSKRREIKTNKLPAIKNNEKSRSFLGSPTGSTNSALSQRKLPQSAVANSSFT